MLRITVVAVVLAATACAVNDPTAVNAPDKAPLTTIARADNGRARLGPHAPPPVVVHLRGGSTELRPWAYCYGSVCVDGAPPKDPAQVGKTDAITVDFPLPDWSFTATFRQVGQKCPREQSASLRRNGDGTLTLRPAGHAGTYDVTLFGKGNGDVITSFRWTTSEDGPLPKPQARVAVLADNHGRVDSYGVELSLSNLASTPVNATATMSVRSRDGAAVTFQPTRALGCIAEGTVAWNGSVDQGRAAAGLGREPFTYVVVVDLDGSHHTATAAWPADVIVGSEPSVELRFTPPLPAMT